MNPEDHLAPEEASIAADIQAAHFAPPATFQNRPLWPYTPATRYWFQQVWTGDDLNSFLDLAFCYVHLKRGGATVRDDVFSIMPELRNGQLFQIRIGDWLQELSGGDFTKADAVYAEAKTIRATAEDLARKAQVSVSDPNGPSNPLAAVPPTTNPGGTPSLPSTGATPTSGDGSGPFGGATPSITPPATAPA